MQSLPARAALPFVVAVCWLALPFSGMRAQTSAGHTPAQSTRSGRPEKATGARNEMPVTQGYGT